MIIIKDKSAIEKMFQSGQKLAQMFVEIEKIVQVGASTRQIDAWIQSWLSVNGFISCTKGYMGYKHSSCLSLNDEVVHGVPSETKLKSGDLIKVDVCASYNGYCADMTRCFLIGDVSAEVKQLVEVAQSALDRAIERAISGNRIGDISSAIQKEVEKFGYGIVRDFAGHGIGKKMHEDPEILNYGEAGCGPLIRSGMAFAIEPMITMKDYKVYITSDGWTVKTVDGSYAAHVEDTVLVTDNGPIVSTRL